MQWRVVHCVVARRREECGIDTQRPRSEPGREGAGEGCKRHESDFESRAYADGRSDGVGG